MAIWHNDQLAKAPWIMKKITALPLFLLTALTSTMAAQVIDGKLLTTITQNGSGTSKFAHVSGGYYDSDIHFGIKTTVQRTPAATSQYSQNIGTINNSTYDALILQSANRHGVDPALVKAIMHTESSFNPHAVSPVGAQGLMQLMPGTARDMGVYNAFDPAQNIEGGVKYIAWLSQRFSNRDHIIAAYNAGHANVRRYGGIPPFKETRNYVRKVNSRYQTLYANDANLNRSNYQLAMNVDTQTTATPTQVFADSTPKTPTLSQAAGKVYINQSK